MDWFEVFLFDATGKRGKSNTCSPDAVPGQIREAQRTVDAIKSGAWSTSGYDPQTVRVVCTFNGVETNHTIQIPDITDDELLASLGVS